MLFRSDCWVRGHEFTLDAQDIDEVLGLEGLEEYKFINYKDRMLSSKIALVDREKGNVSIPQLFQLT